MKISKIEWFGLGLLITAWLLFGGHYIGDTLVHADEGNIDALRIATNETESSDDQTAQAAPQVDFPTLMASADVDKGEKIFKKCHACHNVKPGAGTKVGPDLWDVVGRPKGSVPGFAYSDGMKNKGGDWTPEELFHFLEDPQKFVKGTKMTFRGIKKPDQRADLITYLMTAK